MAHSLILGVTECGKSSLARIICDRLTSRKMKCIVLDPLRQKWPTPFVYKSYDEFMRAVSKSENFNAFLFIDESATAIGRYNFGAEFLSTTSRHLGNSCFFIAHRTAQLPKTLYTNCRYLYQFCCAEDDALDMAREFNFPELKKLYVMPFYQFYRVSRKGEICKGRLTHGGNKLEYGLIRKAFA